MKNKKLGDYVDIVSGYAFKSKEFDTEGVPVIRMSDLYQNKIRITANTVRVADINIDERFLIHKGDVLLGLSGSIGKMGIVDINRKMFLNQRIAKIVPKNNKISRVFLIYLIRQIGERMKRDSVGGTVSNISPNILKNYDVWIPRIENQKKIANTLDLASELIEKRKEQIAEMDKLIQSVFYEMFGDPITKFKVNFYEKRLELLTKQIYGGGTPSKSNLQFYEGSIPWITPKDMKIKYISDSRDHINDDAIKKSSVKLVPMNSLLMVIRSGILKRFIPLAINKTEVTVNQDMKAFIFTDEVNNQFIF